MSEAQSIIPSLYLPVTHAQLILPNVSVAEVVSYQVPVNDNDNDKPDYFLGLISWRGINIPLISYELANGQEAGKVVANARIAVINTIGEHKNDLPFFAIVTQGIPRLVKVSSDITSEENQSCGKADSSVVKLDGEVAIIPDISYLESLAYKHI